jgi:DNA (cytosine-5)-methyltransferase 1
MTQLTFGSLFAGIGGLDLGFERAGLKCKWQVEIDPYARRVLAKHWPDVHRWDDVRTWPQQNTEPVDVIIGGFPCQDISYAGKGAGLHGERSGLWFEFARVVREMGPEFVVVENVAALLNRGLGNVLGTLASLGYDAEWHCIPAAAVGAPHIRDRVFILAYAKGKRRRKTRQCSQRQKEWASFGGEVLANSNSKGLQIRNERQNNPEETRTVISRSELERAYTTIGRKQWEVEPSVGRVADGISNRVDRLRCLGNAVVPQVAEVVARLLLKTVDTESSAKS